MRFPVGLLMITRRLSTALTTTTTTRIAIIGSGASGTFTALVAAENAAKANDKVIISVYEATAFQCSKVKISGGGRCNVLHSPADFSLPLSYPRGAKELRSTFSPKQKFTPENMVEFFESRGLPLHTESDGRMFPRSNKSQSVIDLLVSNSKEAGVDFKLKEAGAPADFSLPLSYPRGAKELRSTFSPKQKFTPENMVEFFESRGLPLHTESDGRMFPRSNKSQSVIDLLVSNSKEAGVDFKLKEAVSSVTVLTDPENSGKFQITTATGGVEEFDKVVLATGSKRSGHAIASSLGHTIVPPVPSLFTVTLSDRLMQTLFEDCAGVSVDSAGIKFAIPNANSKVSERSERALMKPRATTKLTLYYSTQFFFTRFTRFALASLKMAHKLAFFARRRRRRRSTLSSEGRFWSPTRGSAGQEY